MRFSVHSAILDAWVESGEAERAREALHEVDRL